MAVMCRYTKMLFAAIVMSKGRDGYADDSLAKVLEMLGENEIVVKSDQ